MRGKAKEVDNKKIIIFSASVLLAIFLFLLITYSPLVSFSPKDAIVKLIRPEDKSVQTDKKTSFGANVSFQTSEKARLQVIIQGVASGKVTSTPAGIDCGFFCTYDFATGSSVILKATPEPGTRFVGWSGECSGTGDCLLVMDSSKIVYATFELESTGTEPKSTSEFTGLDLDENGFSIFNASGDTEVTFVSSSDGDDSACRTYSATSLGIENSRDLDSFDTSAAGVIPCESVEKGKSLWQDSSRDGFPDWMVLKRGDEWRETIGPVTKNGRSRTERAVVTTYGSATERPTLKESNATAISICCSGKDYLAFTGLFFYAHERDPHNPEFSLAFAQEGPLGVRMCCGEGKDILYEDNRWHFFSSIVLRTGSTGTDTESIAFRKNVVTNAYHYTGSHSQGVWSTRIKDLLIEDNVFYHNGWNPDVDFLGTGPTIYNHNIYLAGENKEGAIVRGNILADAASQGLQLRQGGDVINNLFVRNPIQGFTRSRGGNVSNNVMIEGEYRDQYPYAGGYVGKDGGAGFGFSVGGKHGSLGAGFVMDETFYFENNIIANRKVEDFGNSPYGIMVLSEELDQTDRQRVIVNDNIVYNWPVNRATLEIRDSPETSAEFRGNIFQQYQERSGSGFRMVQHDDPIDKSRYSYTANVYHTIRPSNSWFRINDVDYDINQWQQLSDELLPIPMEVQFSDPQRSVGSYCSVVGCSGGSTYEAFIAEAVEQSRFNYREEYTACAVNNYIREGFDKAQIVCN